MDIALVTGSAGLIGAEAVRFLSDKGLTVVGIDNDMRRDFFGADASTDWQRRLLEEQVRGYVHHSIDIRDQAAIDRVFSEYGRDVRLIVHAAAQPSHDWAARAPIVDFTTNANGTLVLLEATRQHCPGSTFIFTSTNKVYGDTPNRLPLVELESRWEVAPDHPFAEHGIDESMSIDHTTHSLFGASKVAADVLVQEYGRYFGMNTGVFRGGCLTGPGHSGTQLHGFLAYLVKCAITGQPYTIFGHKGKQVRDNIHSFDLVNMFWHFHQDPRPGEVYNAGGGRFSNCSMAEAIAFCERATGTSMTVTHSDVPRVGDHVWYVSDVRKFQRHYPEWAYRYSLDDTLHELLEGIGARV